MVCKIVKELMEFIEDECLEFMEVVVLFLGLFLMVVFDFEILQNFDVYRGELIIY